MEFPATRLDYVLADGARIFYRHASPSADATADAADAPTVLLLHGYPTSSHMFRHLLPRLAARGYRVLAPDLPGFGFTELPPAAARDDYASFSRLTTTLAAFVDATGLDRRPFAVYIFDYGAPTALRFALQRPTALAALVTQNGNAYTDGLGDAFWAPARVFWAQPRDDAAARAALWPITDEAATRWQYTHGRPAAAGPVPPEAYTLDQALLDRPGARDRQLDLLHDYAGNVALYPAFQAWLRSAQAPPVLAIWGRHDDIFVPAGAEAYGRDVAPARFRLHWLDGGHFALEGNEDEVAAVMDDFFQTQRVFA